MFTKFSNWFWKLFYKSDTISDMGIQIGPWDPMKLSFSILNVLLTTNKITSDEAKKIIHDALPDSMPEQDKQVIINSMIVTKPSNNQ